MSVRAMFIALIVVCATGSVVSHMAKPSESTPVLNNGLSTQTQEAMTNMGISE